MPITVPTHIDLPPAKTLPKDTTVESPDYTIKLSIIGNTKTGKSTMVYAYKEGTAASSVPDTEELGPVKKFIKTEGEGGKTIALSINDLDCKNINDRYRPRGYLGTQALLVCFSIDDPASFERVDDLWLIEAGMYSPDVPYVLVGLKSDLRSDPATIERLKADNQAPVTTEEALNYAKEHSAAGYLECSALLNKGISKVFETAALLAIEGGFVPPTKDEEGKCCSVM